jgi:hypothetical protein
LDGSDLKPVEVVGGSPGEGGVRLRVEVVEVVRDFVVDLVDQRDVLEGLVEVVATQHEDKDYEAKRRHQTDRLEDCINVVILGDFRVWLLVVSRIIIAKRARDNQK